MVKQLRAYWSPPAFWQHLDFRKRVYLVAGLCVASAFTAVLVDASGFADTSRLESFLPRDASTAFTLFRFGITAAINVAVVLLGVTALDFRQSAASNSAPHEDPANSIWAALFTRAVFSSGIIALSVPVVCPQLLQFLWMNGHSDSATYYLLGQAAYAATYLLMLVARALPLTAVGIALAALCKRRHMAIAVAVLGTVLAHVALRHASGGVFADYDGFGIERAIVLGLYSIVAFISPALGIPTPTYLVYGGYGGYFSFGVGCMVLWLVTVPQVCFYIASHVRRQAAMRAQSVS